MNNLQFLHSNIQSMYVVFKKGIIKYIGALLEKK